MALALVLLATSVPGPTHAAPAVCVETSVAPSSAAALKPSDVLLAISTPRAGETMLEVPPSLFVTVSVDYWGPPLVPAQRSKTSRTVATP